MYSTMVKVYRNYDRKYDGDVVVKKRENVGAREEDDFA